ncbi:MAG: hypothetical protein ACHP84_08180 [Caulobacterales bacterium]
MDVHSQRSVLQSGMVVLSLALALLSSPALGEDLPGSEDPADLARYPDSQIIHYLPTGYREYRLDYDGGWGKTKTIEGDVTRAVYLVPAGSTSLSVFRYYEHVLSSVGLKRTFELGSKSVSTIDSYFFEQFFFGPESYDASAPSSLYKYCQSADFPYYASYSGVIDGRNATVAILVGQSGDMSWVEPMQSEIPIQKDQAVVSVDVVFPS